MRADGMTSHWRCTGILAGTTDHSSMEEFEVDPHTVVSGVETTAKTATKELLI